MAEEADLVPRGYPPPSREYLEGHEVALEPDDFRERLPEARSDLGELAVAHALRPDLDDVARDGLDLVVYLFHAYLEVPATRLSSSPDRALITSARSSASIA